MSINWYPWTVHWINWTEQIRPRVFRGQIILASKAPEFAWFYGVTFGRFQWANQKINQRFGRFFLKKIGLYLPWWGFWIFYPPGNWHNSLPKSLQKSMIFFFLRWDMVGLSCRVHWNLGDFCFEIPPWIPWRQILSTPQRHRKSHEVTISAPPSLAFSYMYLDMIYQR